MSRNRQRRGKKTNILLGFICILLAGALGTLLVMNYKAEQEESQRLTELAGKQQSGIEDYESVKEHAKELQDVDENEKTDTVEADKNTEASVKSEKKDTENVENTNTSNDQEDTKTVTDSVESDSTEKSAGIVCWGDDLINGEATATYSYMAVLQKLLTDNGYDLAVINKTLQGGGTLSMMKMAGVSDETLQGYITKHQQGANGAQLNITETGIRDLTEEETNRNDLDCIPVIYMGYYGGWNHDPAELAEQQEQILNTFKNKDRFIVVGSIPMDSSVSAAALDQVLGQKWGEHYISYASVTTQPSSTYQGQQAIAEAVFQKLQDLGYISKN